MKRIYKICLVIVSLFALGAAAIYVYRHKYNENLMENIANTAVDTDYYRPYVLGRNISFADGGNSAEFIRTSDGWGGQEPEHRCAIGNKSVIRLYIPNSVGADLRLTVDGFGVFNPKKYQNQEVNVYANEELVASWSAAYDGPFVANLPTNLVQNNTLTLRFEFSHPYKASKNSPAISMAVKNIRISRRIGVRLKQKIGKWIKEQLNGGDFQSENEVNATK